MLGINKSVLSVVPLLCISCVQCSYQQAKQHYALAYSYWEHPGGELQVVGKWDNGRTKWLEGDGGMSEYTFEERERSDTQVVLYDTSRNVFITLGHGKSWLQWEGQADQHELFKGEFVPRPLTYTVEGQKFTLAGSTVPVPGQTEITTYKQNKNGFNGETVNTYIVDWDASNEDALVLANMADKNGDMLAVYREGIVSQGKNTSELGSRNIISSDGQWTLPTRSHMPTILDPPIDVYKFGSTPDATDPKRGNAKIAMLTLNTPNIHLYSDLATINQKAYAEKHGYDFYVYKDSTLGWEMEKGSWDSIVTWNKVNAIPRHLHDHEWMFWIDSDAVFTNMSIKLESFIERAPGKDFLIADDPAGWMLNTGVMFFKNAEWTHSMLRKWWAMPKHQHNQGAEQNQLIKLLGHIDAKRENWQLFEECDFNCLPKNRFPGVFIVHYMGHWPNEKRAALIKENVALGLMTEPDAAKDEL